MRAIVVDDSRPMRLDEAPALALALIAVRADARLRDMTLVMVTPESGHGLIVRAPAADAHEYVIKPLTPGAMVEKLALLGLVENGANG